MAQHRDNQWTILRRPVRRLLVMLTFAIAVTGVILGCSTEARYRMKTIIFTGVPPLHDEQATDGVDAEQATPDTEQTAQQQQPEELVSPYWQHGPFAAGECGRCHSLGQSQSFLGSRQSTSQAPPPTSSVSASSRLTMPTQQLCISCHTQHAATFAGEHDLQQHFPSAIGACTNCHNPHQSLRRYMLLKADNLELCGGCHNPVTLSPVHAEDPERDCIDCHNAHVGVTSQMLKSDARELALLYGGGSE